MLQCLWCLDSVGGPVALRICTTCAPEGDTRHECQAGKGHRSTYSAKSCAACDEEATRAARAKAANAPMLAQLKEIRANHVRDFAKPAPGLEFAKVLFGRILDDAIAELER